MDELQNHALSTEEKVVKEKDELMKRSGREVRAVQAQKKDREKAAAKAEADKPKRRRKTSADYLVGFPEWYRVLVERLGGLPKDRLDEVFRLASLLREGGIPGMQIVIPEAILAPIEAMEERLGNIERVLVGMHEGLILLRGMLEAGSVVSTNQRPMMAPGSAQFPAGPASLQKTVLLREADGSLTKRGGEPQVLDLEVLERAALTVQGQLGKGVASLLRISMRELQAQVAAGKPIPSDLVRYLSSAVETKTMRLAPEPDDDEQVRRVEDQEEPISTSEANDLLHEALEERARQRSLSEEG